MELHPVCRHILDLEQQTAELIAQLMELQKSGNHVELDQAKASLDRVLSELEVAFGQRAELLEELGVPPILGWSRRQ